VPVQAHQQGALTPWCITCICYKQAAPGLAPWRACLDGKRRPRAAAAGAGGAAGAPPGRRAAQRFPAGPPRAADGGLCARQDRGRGVQQPLHADAVFDGYLAALANVFTPTAPLLFNAQCAHVPGTVLRTNSHFHPAKQAEQACYAALSAAAWPHQAILMLKAVCEIACARWCQVPHGRAVRHRKLPLHSRQCAAEWHAGVAHQPAGAGAPLRRRPPPHRLPICVTELMLPVATLPARESTAGTCAASLPVSREHRQRCGGAVGHDCSPDSTV